MTGSTNALLRGAYMKTVAVMEHNGVPIDTETLDRLRTNWTAIKAELIREVDRDYDVYDDGVFRAGRFAAYLDRVGNPQLAPLATPGSCCWTRTRSSR